MQSKSAFDECIESVERIAFYEMITSFSAKAILMGRKQDAQDIDEAFEDKGNNINVANVRNPEFRKMLIRRLPVYEKIGLLDYQR